MRSFTLLVLLACCGGLLRAQTTLEQLTAYPFPSELRTAATGSRVVVAINQQGRRNLYVAEGPSFALRKLTAYDADQGNEITGVQLSPDGEWVVFVKGGDHGAFNGTTPRNPASLPFQPKVQIWSIPFTGGEPILLGHGDEPAISPAGDRVA